MFRKKRRSSRSPSLFGRLFRSLFAILILTGLVYGLSLSIKGIYNLDSETFAAYTAPVLSRIGLTEEETGEVAGEFVQRFNQTGINTYPRVEKTYTPDSPDGTLPSVAAEGSSDILSNSDVQPLAKIALMADVHEDWDYLEKALENAKQLNVDTVFYLGDLSDWGDVTTLEKGRSILEESNLPWEILPGDHDLAQSASRNEGYGLENFQEVFGIDYKLVEIGGYTFMLFDNSANFTAIDETRFTWFLSNIGNADYVVLAQPIFHPTNPVIMGLVDGDETKIVADQRNIILSQIRKANVKAVIAADQHISSINVDASDTELTHIVVGALTKRRNYQTPRYSIMNLFANGDYTIDEVIL